MQLGVALRAGLVSRTRRGLGGQLRRRTVEQALRRGVLAFIRWAGRACGWSRTQAAQCLGLAERTLRGWARRRRTTPRVVARGRPAHRSDWATRQAIFALCDLVGPGIRFAEVERAFPTTPPGELREFVQRYRQVCRERWNSTMLATRWTTAGTVWAMDHTQPPVPIDGCFPKVLVVRDLASGAQLEALAVPDESHVDVVGLLERLFAAYGPPLVLKHDNGPAFRNQWVERLLARHGVLALLSPPYRPQYNGACEAGIGRLKTRCQLRATRHDRPCAWSSDDLEYARCDGNAFSRPDGRGTPTSAERWAARPVVPAEFRPVLWADVAQMQEECAVERGAITFTALDREAQRTVRRFAISHTLQAHGLLQFRRRPVSLPKTRRKAAINS